MDSWTEDELTQLANADELQISSRRPDGTLRPYVTIWVVRSGDGVYVRSAYGATNPWFVRAKRSGFGRIRAGSLEKNVRFSDAEASASPEIDAAYHAKYDRYGPRIVNTVVGPEAPRTTLRLVPSTT
ncbi:DUF2255 family protein [Mycetocola zhadangensis]|uniref:DUF2255 family protein n=1 Tax=Mycetocola zhadangensis TaxID=1164595 RepID=A0A3L7J4Y4_9MICO|nr:DUF2255 family protein [Mycetocola zhadangensis]RLQ85584.1 DUF2255 family protein [Mycetocola zhadangensis]GGE83892.1 hypothetical protein GCM10011313_02940 [Mycetocola zhadangensis]